MIKDIATVALIALVIDAAACAAWMVSGQTPVDGFHLGAITKSVVNLFI